MKTRTAVLLAVGAILAAALSFLLVSYVLPRASGSVADGARLSRSAISDDASGAAQGETPGSLGIEAPASPTGDAPAAPGSAAPSGSGTAGSTGGSGALTADALFDLDESAPGHVIGQVLAIDEAAHTIDIRAEVFSVLAQAHDGSSEELSLPRGTKVTLVLPPNADTGPHSALTEVGNTIRANIRVEPAGRDARGRIVAVSVEVIGSRQ